MRNLCWRRLSQPTRLDSAASPPADRGKQATSSSGVYKRAAASGFSSLGVQHVYFPIER